MKIRSCIFYALLFLIVFMSLQDLAYALVDPQKLDVTVKDIKLQKLENSNLLRVNVKILNNGDEEANFFSGNFKLLDSKLREFSAVSNYDLKEKGESISYGICDTVFGQGVNPGLSMDLEICFDVPKTNFQYDSMLIYENMFIQSSNTAKIVPLVENSIGYKTLVQKIKPENEELAQRSDEIESEGGCLIATAAYGTELAPEVQNLREIRNKMYETKLGGDIMMSVNNFYYSFSPTVADWERQNVIFKEFIKLAITPSITSFAILEHNTIDTEAGLIGYVLSIVSLNIGMYFVAPAIVIHTIKKKF